MIWFLAAILGGVWWMVEIDWKRAAWFVQAFGCLLFGMSWYPCPGCCPGCVDCDTGTTPSSVEVTFTGITANGANCADLNCTDFNITTFVCDAVDPIESTCTWEEEDNVPCGTAHPTFGRYSKVSYGVDGAKNFVVISGTGGADTIAFWNQPVESDCSVELVDIPFKAHGGSDPLCDGSSATTTVTPV